MRLATGQKMSRKALFGSDADHTSGWTHRYVRRLLDEELVIKHGSASGRGSKYTVYEAVDSAYMRRMATDEVVLAKWMFASGPAVDDTDSELLSTDPVEQSPEAPQLPVLLQPDPTEHRSRLNGQLKFPSATTAAPDAPSVRSELSPPPPPPPPLPRVWTREEREVVDAEKRRLLAEPPSPPPPPLPGDQVPPTVSANDQILLLLSQVLDTVVLLAENMIYVRQRVDALTSTINGAVDASASDNDV